MNYKVTIVYEYVVPNADCTMDELRDSILEDTILHTQDHTPDVTVELATE